MWKKLSPPSSILLLVVLVLAVIINIFTLFVDGSLQLIFLVNDREVPSIRYLLQNYGLDWQLNDLVLNATIPDGDFIKTTPDGYLKELHLSYITPQFVKVPFLDNGPPDPNFKWFDLPFLESLYVSVVPRDGSYNILEMTRGLPSLKLLDIGGHYINYIPNGFPFTKTLEILEMQTSYSWLHPKNLNSIYYPSLYKWSFSHFAKEPLPDGVAEDIVGSLFMPSNVEELQRLPDSLWVTPVWEETVFNSYISECFKCYNRQFSNLLFPLYRTYPMDCDVTVSSLRYHGESVRIEGNNLLNAVAERDVFSNIPLPFITPGGQLTPVVPNKVLEYDRTHPSLIEEDVVIGNNTVTNFIATVKISFTTINIDGGMVSSQLPYGLYIRVPLNYNHLIDHKIVINGLPCLKQTILYQSDSILQCFVPILISQPQLYLTFQISNIKNTAVTYFNLIRSYPNINNTIEINMDDILDANYNNSTIALKGIFSHDQDELPIEPIVLINDQECLVQSINFTSLSCTINLKNILLTNNNNNNNNNNLKQLDLFVEIEGHSFSSSNIISIILPSNSNSNSNDSSNSSSNNYSSSEEEQEKEKDNTKQMVLYIMVSIVGAVVLVSAIVIAVRKIQSNQVKKINNNNINSNEEIKMSNFEIDLKSKLN
ncbi:hypothetical protein DFA_06400 [Cavenderia fasciculata]|uniref:Uncharacterized protein n=1 Tax=Cavenderia fasciculata TaxID=261658 RepID=F4PIW4_CACFS|nr:uncharacterized protein DFA_06400 [Cavenderia fasciculata]EGG24250.1 hypothetical protein DFA_06400 [Cavenderia fasciculata]|eukprot:XP_004362101.1 hypothetical protein DFA_06400 [Cavenderia fasciculata]